jgi:glycosyltransferase involved in cell wall biosynthesis
LESPLVDLVVVARSCAGSLESVLAALPPRTVRTVIVVDNGSNDQTPLVARDFGAVVLFEGTAGYGAACRRAIAHLEGLPRPPDIVVVMGGDGADDPADIPALLAPMADGAELVIGVADHDRVGGATARVAIGLIGVIYRQKFAGLGRFRAIRFPALVALGLIERGDAFLVEMQVKGLTFGLRIAEVEVSRRPAMVAPEPGSARLKRRVSSTGRVLFQILRHATVR